MQKTMSRKVSVLVQGTHRNYESEKTEKSIEQKESSYQLEMRAMGEYCERNGKHYIRYEEISEESGQPVSHLLKIRGKNVEHILDGGIAGHLYFEEGKRHNTDYRTQMGSLEVEVDTKSVEMTESERGIFARVEYELYLNGEKVADTTTCISVEFAEK